MENFRFLFCKICLLEFDMSTIPVVLPCGLTICRSCVGKLIDAKSSCPACKNRITGNVLSFPVNISLLEFVMSLHLSHKDAKNSHQVKFSKVKRQLLESFASSTKIEATKKPTVLNAMKKTQTLLQMIRNEAVVPQGHSASLISRSPCNSSLLFLEGALFMQTICRNIKLYEKIYTVRRIEDEVKYGEIILFQNSLLFHDLNLVNVPEDSFLIQFDDIASYFFFGESSYAFITFKSPACYNCLLKFKFDNERPWKTFMNLCSGVYGPSYKNSFQTNYVEDAQFSDDIDSIPLLNIVPNSQKCEEEVDEPNRYISNHLEKDFLNESLLVENIFVKKLSDSGCFSIICSKKCQERAEDVVAKAEIMFPSTDPKILNEAFTKETKILECGILYQL